MGGGTRKGLASMHRGTRKGLPCAHDYTHTCIANLLLLDLNKVVGKDPKGVALHVMDISVMRTYTLGLCGGLVGGKPHHIACVTANRLPEISARCLSFFPQPISHRCLATAK